MRVVTAKFRAARAFSSSLLFGAAAGCGHPATIGECQEILTRIAELELRERNVVDPAVIAERVDSARRESGNELLERCVGRRISDRAMQCVRHARSAEEVTSACMYRW